MPGFSLCGAAQEGIDRAEQRGLLLRAERIDLLAAQTSPVTGTTTYAYGKSGTLLTTADANGATTTRSYDALDRVTGAVSTRGGQTDTINWTYDSGPFGLGAHDLDDRPCRIDGLHL